MNYLKTIRKKNPQRKNAKKQELVFKISWKSIFVLTVYILAMVFLFGQVIYLQAQNGEKYTAKTVSQRAGVKDRILPPVRGSILDRNSQIMSKSNLVYTVVAYPDILGAKMDVDSENRDKDEDGNIIDYKSKTISSLVSVLEIGNISLTDDKMKVIPQSEEELASYFEKNADGEYNKYKIIARKVSHEKYKQLKEAKLVGVGFESDSERVYPYEKLGASVVGFMGTDTGLLGLEKQYNQYLNGVPGRTFSVYSEDGVNEETIETQDGNTIVTTIDTNIQKFAEQAIENEMKVSKPERAAIIVMNPNTGEILAMACSPGFDLNNPYNLSNSGIDEDSATSEKKNDTLFSIWRNYNVSDTYEPGSTFKPIVVAAALEEGIISTNTPFYCGGSKTFEELTKPIYCWYKLGHNTQTLEEALANSCNVAMMEIGARMGKELFYKYQKAFGFGENTGIDLPGEASASALMHDLENINRVELATMSFGQTFNCTPLQLLNAFAAVINGGNLMKPYVVSQVLNSNGDMVSQNEPSIVRKVISKDVSDIVREYLQAVVERGTGKKIKIEGYNIAGKTGTAQQGKRSENIEDDEFVLSFVAFAPIDNPEIIAISLLDRPIQKDKGSAAPMLKELFEKTLPYIGLEKTDTGDSQDELQNISVTVDDYGGRSVTEATAGIAMLNLSCEVIGGGSVVTSQFPEAGTSLKEGDKVTIWTKKSDENSQKVTVTNLSGLSYDEAVSKLEELQIVPVVEGDKEGKVVDQDPKEGTQIEIGGSVRIKFEK